MVSVQTAAMWSNAVFLEQLQRQPADLSFRKNPQFRAPIAAAGRSAPLAVSVRRKR
jgi:hypothetical protein